MNRDLFLIKGLGGKKKLAGKIEVKGAKNAALPAMAAAILFADKIKYQNVPFISDVGMMGELLEDLGADAEKISKYSLSISAGSFFSPSSAGSSSVFPGC